MANEQKHSPRTSTAAYLGFQFSEDVLSAESVQHHFVKPNSIKALEERIADLLGSDAPRARELLAAERNGRRGKALILSAIRTMYLDHDPATASYLLNEAIADPTNTPFRAELQMLESRVSSCLGALFTEHSARTIQDTVAGGNPDILNAAAAVYANHQFLQPVLPSRGPIGITTVNNRKVVMRFAPRAELLRDEALQHDYFRRLNRHLPDEIKPYTHVPTIFGIGHVHDQFALLREYIEGTVALDRFEQIVHTLTDPTAGPETKRYHHHAYEKLMRELFRQAAYTCALGPFAGAKAPLNRGVRHYRERLSTRILQEVNGLLGYFHIETLGGKFLMELEACTHPLSVVLEHAPDTYYKDPYINNSVISGKSAPQLTNLDFAGTYSRAPLAISLATVLAYGERLTTPELEVELVRQSIEDYLKAQSIFNTVVADYHQDPFQFIHMEMGADMKETPPSVSRADVDLADWLFLSPISPTKGVKWKTPHQKLYTAQRWMWNQRRTAAASYVRSLRYFVNNLKPKGDYFSKLEPQEDVLHQEIRRFYAALVHRSLLMIGAHAGFARRLAERGEGEKVKRTLQGISGSLHTAIYANDRYAYTLATGALVSPTDPRHQIAGDLRSCLNDLTDRFQRLLDQCGVKPYNPDAFSVPRPEIAAE